MPLRGGEAVKSHCLVAPRNNAAQVAKATMDLFQKTNEM
jgi:hypothetical protein